jgi:hypothetical protein
MTPKVAALHGIGFIGSPVAAIEASGPATRRIYAPSEHDDAH